MQSEQINELAAALSKAQAKLRGAVKDSTNPFFKSNYADLQSVWDACRDPLSTNGLSIIQTTSCSDDKGVSVITTLAHSSGQWVKGVLPIAAVKHDPQAQGAAISYARRYALAAIVGLYQTDDDAEIAMNRPTRDLNEKYKKPAAQGPAPKPVQTIAPPKEPDFDPNFDKDVVPLGDTVILVGTRSSSIYGQTFAQVGKEKLLGQVTKAERFFNDQKREVPADWQDFFGKAKQFCTEE